MSVIRYATANAFLEAAQELLESDEAVNCVPLGVSLAQRGKSAEQMTDWYFATFGDNAAAMMTPGYCVTIACRGNPTGPAAAFAADLNGLGPKPPGVVGPKPIAAAFAQAWAMFSGEGHRVRRRLRIFEARQVVEPPSPGGEMITATDKHVDLATDWTAAFTVEAHTQKAGEDHARALAQAKIDAGDLVLWMDGEPVSMAGRARATPHGVSVNLVYTPPAKRRRGYATALVGALSRRLLDERAAFCCLFTDLANPVSNSIYPKVGYKPVCDVDELRFEGEGDAGEPGDAAR